MGVALASRNLGGDGAKESESVTRCVGGEGEEGGKDGDEVVTVLFSMRCAKFLDLQVGSCIRIHPPW